VDAGSGGSIWLDPEHLEASRRESRALRQLSEQARARARETRHKVRWGRSQRQEPGEKAIARLQARMGTLPMIEQAKGIIMAQQRCGPEEAFELLRRISQRTNIRVHVLAAQLLEQTAANGNHDNMTPITLGARRYQRPRTADPATRRA
jgi:hypothetical protein